MRLATYLPRFLHTTKKKEIMRPVFPGYMFVRFNIQLDVWEGLYAVEGVKRVFSCGPYRPTAIHPSVIAQIMLEEGMMPQLAPPLAAPATYEAGQQVKILKGPMKDFVGICTKSADQRVSILLTLLGRQFESEYTIEDVMQVA